MKLLYISLGFLSLSIGVVGIILPIVPTTPFLLLTAFSFSKGSNKFHDWFTSTTLYKKFLEEFIVNKTMTRKHKWILLLSVDTMLIISYTLITSIPVRVLILSLIIMKHLYFFKYVEIRRSPHI